VTGRYRPIAAGQVSTKQTFVAYSYLEQVSDALLNFDSEISRHVISLGAAASFDDKATLTSKIPYCTSLDTDFFPGEATTS